MPTPLRFRRSFAFIFRFVVAAVSLLVVVGCSSGSNSTSADSTSAVAAGDVADIAPVLQAGAVSAAEVKIDGVTVEYVIAAPPGFAIGDDAPVLLAFPPGSQSLELAQQLVVDTYRSEANRLGWVVVSPTAADGVLFFKGSERLLPGFVDWIETWVTPEGGSPHVAGVSNGGLSAFRYAVENPDRVRSIVAFPGFAQSDDDLAGLSSLSDVPVSVFVGATDTAWVGPAEETVRLLNESGGEASLTIAPGEGHILDLTADGTLVFERLQSAR